MTPAENHRAELARYEAQVELRLHRYPGCQGAVRRWFVVGVEHPFRTEAEALQVAARLHERRAP